MLEGIIELSQFEVDDQVIKKNKLKGITEITLNLDELNNSDNLNNLFVIGKVQNPEKVFDFLAVCQCMRLWAMIISTFVFCGISYFHECTFGH